MPKSKKYVRVKASRYGEDYEYDITKKEKKLYEKLASKVNKKRTRLMKHADRLQDPNLVKTVNPTTVRFVPAKPVPLKGLTSRQAFDRALEKLKEHNKSTFFKDRSEIYRTNIITALNKVYNSDAKELIGLINRLSPEQLQWLLLRHPNDFSIDFIYFDKFLGTDNLDFLVKVVKDALDMKVGKIK